jgi:hypothetical protein
MSILEVVGLTLGGDGHTDILNDFVEQRSCGDFPESAFGAEDDAVREHGLDHALDIIGDDEVATLENCVGLRGSEEGN